MIRKLSLLALILSVNNTAWSMKSSCPTQNISLKIPKEFVLTSLKEMNKFITIYGEIRCTSTYGDNCIIYHIQQESKELFAHYCALGYTCWLILEKKAPFALKLSEEDAEELFHTMHRGFIRSLATKNKHEWPGYRDGFLRKKELFDAQRERLAKAGTVKVSVATQTDPTLSKSKSESKEEAVDAVISAEISAEHPSTSLSSNSSTKKI
jgi:hypothetical protein